MLTPPGPSTRTPLDPTRRHSPTFAVVIPLSLHRPTHTSHHPRSQPALLDPDSSYNSKHARANHVQHDPYCHTKSHLSPPPPKVTCLKSPQTILSHSVDIRDLIVDHTPLLYLARELLELDGPRIVRVELIEERVQLPLGCPYVQSGHRLGKLPTRQATATVGIPRLHARSESRDTIRTDIARVSGPQSRATSQCAECGWVGVGWEHKYTSGCESAPGRHR